MPCIFEVYTCVLCLKNGYMYDGYVCICVVHVGSNWYIQV